MAMAHVLTMLAVSTVSVMRDFYQDLMKSVKVSETQHNLFITLLLNQINLPF